MQSMRRIDTDCTSDAVNMWRRCDCGERRVSRERAAQSVGEDCVFFQAEDGIRDLVRSRGLGDVYKRQTKKHASIFYRHSGSS